MDGKKLGIYDDWNRTNMYFCCGENERLGGEKRFTSMNIEQYREQIN
jgi:hypothetical protein